MPYEIYKLIHILAIFSLLVSLAVLTGFALLERQELGKSARRNFAIAHGLSLFFILLGGFGLMARLGVAHNGWPIWIWVKLLVWILFGASYVLIKRRLVAAKQYLGIMGVLVMVAAIMAIYKPGG